MSPDITWENPLPAIWSSSECNVGIICSCLPTLKGCFTRCAPRLFPSVTSASRRSGRQIRTIGGSEPGLHLPGTTAKAFELVGGDKSETWSHVRTCESQESLREVEPHQSQDEIQEHAHPRNYSWLHDASTKGDTESQVSNTGPQYNAPLSSHQLV